MNFERIGLAVILCCVAVGIFGYMLGELQTRNKITEDCRTWGAFATMHGAYDCKKREDKQ